MSFIGDMRRKAKMELQTGTSGDIDFYLGSVYAGNIFTPPKNVYYVDCRVTSSGTGRSWDKAYKTIQEAITASNATIDWGETPWLVDNWILVASGDYAENLTPGYSCHIVGMGQPGTDQAVEIHPATGDCMAGTGLGLHLCNLRFEVTDASECLDFGICNNCLIENCVFVCGIAGTGTNAISTENCTHLRLLNCRFEHGANDGWDRCLYFGGGANKYLHHAEIRGNIFQGLGNNNTAIEIAANCTDTNAVIANNIFKIPGTGNGILSSGGDNVLIADNNIVVEGAGDAINGASSSRTSANRLLVNGTAAWETTGL